MIGIGSNKKIIDIYNEIKDGTEVLVVDGQQRLSTIYEYIMDADTFEYQKIKKFNELSSEEQTNFFYYVVVVRDLGHIPMSKIRQIFKRINSVDYALEAIEINNALYDGEYITTTKTILKKLKLYSTIKDNDISRMKDLEFILAVMVTNDLQAYFPRYKEVENFVKSYDDLYPYKKQTLDKFKVIIKLLSSLKIREDSIWINSKSCYFTLLVELLKLSNKILITEHVIRLEKNLKNYISK